MSSSGQTRFPCKERQGAGLHPSERWSMLKRACDWRAAHLILSGQDGGRQSVAIVPFVALCVVYTVQSDKPPSASSIVGHRRAIKQGLGLFERC
ncbi:hypothetical protein PLICRDRAFT_44555 [Plicaturopsis crispa FD-325 SS-3]|nr:hypothetical protein PLICRDRAFT_44555 [Plicaturopsis crispa FD-325 SS-3]